jgi:hypothetical protein
VAQGAKEGLKSSKELVELTAGSQGRTFNSTLTWAKCEQIGLEFENAALKAMCEVDQDGQRPTQSPGSILGM